MTPPTVRRARAALPAVVLALLVAAVPGAGAGPSAASAAGPAARPALAPAASPTTVEVPRLQRQGRWMVDQHGRVVLVHGLNLVWKLDPYVPPATAAGFRAADADFFRRYGFNGARVGTLWAGLTPDAPGVADPAYLDRWQRVLDLLADRGIWIQLDLHQDQWHEMYGGEGVPDWAVEQRPAPFAGTPVVTAPFPMGYWTPEVSRVFDDFWSGVGGVRDGWVQAWEVAARRWHDQPWSMGYDLLNEPWAGTEGMTCLADGCPATYRDELQPTFELALRAIRAIDPHSIVWFEPQQFAGGQPLDTFFTAVDGERNLGFSWHSYCPQVFLESQGVPGSDTEQCTDFSTGRVEHALDQARTMRAASVMSEFGATDNLRALEIDTQVAAEHHMSWMHWAYKGWGDPTTADGAQGLFHDDADLTSVKRAKLRTLVQTYPQATAGVPGPLTFDARTGDFRYTYTPRDLRDAAGRRVPTVVFVSPLHHDGAPRVTVRHGRLLGDPGDRRLRVLADGEAPVTITVRDR